MEVYRKIKCTLSYDGTNYAGYQVQNNAITVQQRVEEALARVTKEKTIIYASGRTDAGVHARGQVFHFTTACRVPVDKWPYALNSLLPHDIAVLDAVEVSDSFHARYDVVEKTYRYCLLNRQFLDVFYRMYAWHVPFTLDVAAMQRATVRLLGEHDFTSFCSARTNVEDKVRHIYEILVREEEGGRIWFTFRGKGFLYNMVRILVGTLVKVGMGEWAENDIPVILAAKDRTKAGPTAPPQGLFLWEVKY